MGSRIETTTLNEMRARDGVLVSRFMTFLNRKNTFVFDLYEKVFFGGPSQEDGFARGQP